METKDMEDFLEPPLSLCRAFLTTYLSPAMILLISGHDVYKINAIVSEMKNSDVAGLNSVASLVAVELQRLSR
ncbi:unnamed protein product [Brassica napus]|uniref:(rape) hypothetical protein n=1 Tax=Brassica napus TaxID=3708 RepID=A0A816S9C2_BRANA|nr:unnamed protein product [Brassica napus]